MHNEHPNIKKESLLSKGNEYLLASNVFNKLQNIVFFETRPDDGDEYVRIYGIANYSRKYMWIKKKYIKNEQSWNKFKIILVAANGSGQINTQIISKPVIGEPMVGYTQSFISVGMFADKTEAENCLKYIKSKFVRTMVSVLKITQNNKKSVWFYVPWQDFSNNSDIKWDCDIKEIDNQLYKKYKLTNNEINFIESNVKAMQ